MGRTTPKTEIRRLSPSAGNPSGHLAIGRVIAFLRRSTAVIVRSTAREDATFWIGPSPTLIGKN